jgi:hypothetical protein
MFELLLEIWRCSRGDEAVSAASHLARCRMRGPRTRRTHQAGPRLEARARDQVAMIKEDGGEIVGTQDFQRFKLMADFYRHVPDILATMFDTVQPRSFEELVQYGFADTTPG